MITYQARHFKDDKGNRRYTVYEISHGIDIAIYETGDRQTAERYADECNRAAALRYR